MHKKPAVIWFTGLPGAGKTTLAQLTKQAIIEAGEPCELLDGDEIRKLFGNSNFSKAARDENVKHVGHCASLLEKNGVYVVVALVSPYEEARTFARNLCENFIEVYVSTSLEVCQRRDPKGFYKKARAGEIKQMSGVDDPYEIPTKPELVLDAGVLPLEECMAEILKKIKP